MPVKTSPHGDTATAAPSRTNTRQRIPSLSIPTRATMASELLDPYPHLLYLDLWLCAATWRLGLPPWLYSYDAAVSEKLRVSPKTLQRARADLVNRGMVIASQSTGARMPTWYGLIWPLPRPEGPPPLLVQYSTPTSSPLHKR